MPAQLEPTARREPALAAARVVVGAMVAVGGLRRRRRRPCRILGRWMTSLREHLQAEGAVRARMLVVISQAVHAARAAGEGQPFAFP